MEFRDIVQAATLNTPQDRLQITTATAPYPPVAYIGADGGLEIGAYSLDIRYVSGEDTLFLSTQVSRWRAWDPVQDYRGAALPGLPNIASVFIEWGDGMVDRALMPFDQPTVHEYPYAGDFVFTAAVEYNFTNYPQHLATAYPTATYTFRARQ